MTFRHPLNDRPHHETEAIRRLGAIAAARGWRLDVEPTTRFAARLTLPGNRHHLLIGADLGLNSSASRRVAEDKALAAHFLALDGLTTVPTFPVADAAGAERTLTVHAIALPCVIKPTRSFEARGLTIVENPSALVPAFEHARAIDPIVLLQPFDPRPEFRLILLDDELIAAFAKHRPRPTAPANLGVGATWADVTPDLHPDHLALARRAGAALALTLAAVDLFTDDIARPTPATILEVNATPGLKALALAPAAGERLFERVAARIAGAG